MVGNYLVDLGGQWVHGPGDNVAYKLAEPLGLLDESNKSDFGLKEIFFDSGANAWEGNVTEKIWNFFLKYVFEPQFEDNITYGSLGQYVEKM